MGGFWLRWSRAPKTHQHDDRTTTATSMRDLYAKNVSQAMMKTYAMP
jgi:hypothetical protein